MLVRGWGGGGGELLQLPIPFSLEHQPFLCLHELLFDRHQLRQVVELLLELARAGRIHIEDHVITLTRQIGGWARNQRHHTAAAGAR